MKTIRFGLIGCGLMGREFASAAARWCHLLEIEIRPEIISICDPHAKNKEWFLVHFPTIQQNATHYLDVLSNPEVDAVYIAVPHHLHQEFYCAAIEAGKHLLGEKPFGIDQAANDTILRCLQKHSTVFVRCSSEFPFFPAMQRIGKMIEKDVFGRIIEVNTGFLHSSDLNANKPISWKRDVKTNGEYGCMGDLGMHVCHVPFRAGWYPTNVRAILSNIIPERPDGQGRKVPCLTWDNATLLCEVQDALRQNCFPWTLKTQRIAPGNKNNWYCEIIGTHASVRWSSKQANTLELLECNGGEQAWQQIDMGYQMTFKSITGEIFQSGFTDSILQMMAAFLYELQHGRPVSKFSGCVTPEETAWSHRLFTAALASHKNHTTEPV
jgi:predicted dehydrogenase